MRKREDIMKGAAVAALGVGLALGSGGSVWNEARANQPTQCGNVCNYFTNAGCATQNIIGSQGWTCTYCLWNCTFCNSTCGHSS